jgi:hypothetical protein
MATFASTTVVSVTIANLTKVGSSGRRDSLGNVSESIRCVQQIDRGEPITAEQVIYVRSNITSSIKTRSCAPITNTSTNEVLVAKRVRRCGKAVSVLFAATNFNCARTCFGGGKTERTLGGGSTKFWVDRASRVTTSLSFDGCSRSTNK